MNVALIGFFTGLSLIMAIGAQNAFVLRQGLRRMHVVQVVLVCIASDAILIFAGVFASGWISMVIPSFAPIMRWGGALFLIVYGGLTMRSAWRGGQHLEPEAGADPSAGAAVLTCLALTWLNPHVYLDTVVLLGAISTEFEAQRSVFAWGAITGSTVFFIALGFGARFLAPVFAKELSWRVLDGVVALVMWRIAATLVWGH